MFTVAGVIPVARKRVATDASGCRCIAAWIARADEVARPSFAIARGLHAVNFHVLTERAGIDGFLRDGGIESDTSDILALLVYWLVILAALIIAFNGLGLTYITDLLGRVLLFVPKVMVALLILAVANEFTRDWVESRLRSTLEGQLSGYLGRPIQLAITIDPTAGTLLEPPDRPDEPEPQPAPPPPADSAPVTTSTRTVGRGSDRLNPKYSFETFVIGDSNRFAHAAAVAVAEAPAKAYNPLFIYGDSGLGKTHLLHAIGHYARNLFPHVKVRYVNSEEFTNDFINSIRDDKASNFQRRYRDVDVLLIDDIQFLQGKVQTQEEFFHTFNTLHNANKQVVITSDQPPKLLSGFEERMRSRFEWGLLTDVQPPDLETRIAILRK